MSSRKAYWVWDIEAETIEGGEFLYQLLGIEDRKEPIHWKLLESEFSEQDLISVQEVLNQHFDSKGKETFRVETSHLLKESGEQINVLWFGEVIQWSIEGKPLKISGLAKKKVDLSAREKLSKLETFLFSRLMEHLNESIFFKDLDSKFIRINAECARKFGLDHPDDAIGKSDFDIFSEEHAREAFQDEQKIIATEEPIFQKVEKETFSDSDEVLWASTTKMPLYDNTGELIGTFGITRDITDKKLLEDELEYNRKMFDKLSELAPGFLFLHKVEKDNTIRFPFASEGINEIFDLKPKDIKDSIKPLLRRVHKDDIKSVLSSIMESVTFLADWNIEYRIHHPTKGERWVRGLAKPEEQEDKSVLSPGYITDITEIKEASERNDKLRLQFQSILNAIPNLIFIKDLSGKYLVVNDAACDFFGIAREDFLGKTDEELGVPEENAQNFRQADLKVIESGEPIFIPEIKTVKETGEEYWHQTIKLPYKQIDTDEEAVLTIVTDITDRKQRESELDNSLEIIGQQNQRLTNFAHIVSHNLRNHAGNISMLLNLHDPEESEEEQREILGYLNTAAENLNESIADLNEIVDQQQMSIDQFKDVNLKVYLEKIKEILVSDILSNNVKFEEDVPEDLVFGYNPAYLESILLNLISNAIKYRKPEVAPRIKITAHETDGSFYLEVSDNGLGIDMQRHQEKLFGMYKTFHGNENAKGIGLFITKNQIESMGGSIEVESEPGEGTTFKIKLK
ncbi:MAG: PAS domain-containing protein [Balneolaceae bacterium]|nr:PAS domain-containing protein [Balneolaceae bacterium]MBO6545500.1 PAS domain-containing protein [Balneolaceae bacterium]MBO6646896.1 PAS domain-containing protein [Balneolaceae bacterium]